MDIKEVLNNENSAEAKKFFEEILDIGINFKLQERVSERAIDEEAIERIVQPLASAGEGLDDILTEFKNNVLPYCTNFSSKRFLGFPDAGNSVGSIGGSILADFLQQNLINQSFCAPSATFVEIAVILWLRELMGYTNHESIESVWDVGGIITPGGTVSNAIGIMLARERKQPGALEDGVRDPQKMKLVVPKGIGHYSVKSAQMWLGCGNNLIEVETNNFRYDLEDLKKKLVENKGSVMAVVAYVGDSRTMTVDNLDAIADTVHSIDPDIWLHADACHGFSLGFSSRLRHKIKGVEKFDSISTDPHKVLLTPYTLSTLLVKNPEDMKKITSISDLIMKEQFAFGQITPFLGSRSWSSLKLWFMMKNFGKEGLDELITKRHERALCLAEKLDNDPDFSLLNQVEINAVGFFFTDNGRITTPEELNNVNQKIHEIILAEGQYHLHQFSVPDPGVFQKGELLYPLRFMCGNPNVVEDDLENMIEYVREVGRRVVAV